jgi:hypothetical protein
MGDLFLKVKDMIGKEACIFMRHSPAANQTERGSSSNTGKFEEWRFNL